MYGFTTSASYESWGIDPANGVFPLRFAATKRGSGAAGQSVSKVRGGAEGVAANVGVVADSRR
jgi:hypothetical protein